jgi:glutamyl-tRNA synthetase
VLSAAELVAQFDLDRVTHSAAGFDRDKLDWLNGEWIRRLALDDLVARVEQLAREEFGDDVDVGVVAAATGIAQERAVTLVQIVEQMGFLFVGEDDFVIAPDSWTVVESTDRIRDVLDAVIAHVETCDWTVEAVDFREALVELGLSKKEIRKSMPAMYAVVEGIHRGLPLFDSMHLLGTERTLARLRAARDRLA